MMLLLGPFEQTEKNGDDDVKTEPQVGISHVGLGFPSVSERSLGVYDPLTFLSLAGGQTSCR